MIPQISTTQPNFKTTSYQLQTNLHLGRFFQKIKPLDKIQIKT
jgi:hypothetical protein